MKFHETSVGQDFYRMCDKIGDISVGHTLYMAEVFHIMQMMQQYDSAVANNVPKEQLESARCLIILAAVSLKDRKEFEAFVQHAPEFEFEFLPALIEKWATNEC